ncbi:unnamed protein product [Rotaria sordida]|uniref:Uncharacterized protein n=1 Tax=Rotaria sordida TaxID=392033 RepID=A0A814UDU6_9BILA|nr:unnamed protein product [Rotaria sordida]CAF3700600.1 unnamed protein product [Rotaria sordida]
MSKRYRDIENKENEPEQSSSLININEPNPKKKVKLIDTKNIQHFEPLSDDDDDDDEDKGPWPIESIIQNNDGTIHPTNKQYILYENTEPNMISRTARFWSRKYLKVLQHVDPDVYDMYIHNDFVCYGELEVIENCLIDIAKGIFLKHKKQMNFSHYIFAFRRLEALTIVLNSSHYFIGIDDGNRIDEILRVIGACYVTILRGLLPKSMFNNEELNDDDMKKLNKISQQLPNFKQVIKQALILGHILLSIGDPRSAYTNVLQTIYCTWSAVMDKIYINLNEKSDKKDENLCKALKHASKIKKNAFKESFNFMKELDLYSKTNPDLGGNSHDLRKWSKTQRNLYLLNKIDDDDEDNDSFWFRL